MKTHYPTIITIGRFAKRVMRTLKNILSSCNGMMFNTIMKLTLMTTLLAVLTTARSPRRINPERRNDTILIIGNGLSTRYLAHLGFDKIPKNVDTFGMGAAHRYYSDIGWWPTYYALCDVKVVFHNQKELKAIVEDPRIPVRKYFLPLRLSDNEKLETVPHSSTGSFCMRKAIELGYKRIFIIGIETDYMEQIKESRVLTPEEIEQTGLGQLEEFKELPANSRCILMVTKTPLVNTNYFFDSYQRKGDIYSLPSGAAHYRQFHEIARLTESSKVNIINLSPTSPLTMFPKASLGDFLNAKTYHSLPVTKPFDTMDRNSRKVSNGAMKGSFFRRFSDYCARNFPVAVTLGRFGKWGLTILKNTFFGIGGIALMVIVGLYVAGALIEPARWYLVGIASASLLLGGGLLALLYVRFTLNRITSYQRTQVSYINKQVSYINKQISDIKKEVSRLNKELSVIKDDVFIIGYDILKEQNKLAEKVSQLKTQASNDRRAKRAPDDSIK